MKNQFSILFIIAVFIGLSGQAFAQKGKGGGRSNKHDAVVSGIVGEFPFGTLYACSYRSPNQVANVESRRLQKPYGINTTGAPGRFPQGDEGLEVAFSPFFSLEPDCSSEFGMWPDTNPLPSEQ